ncbi:flagellar hook-length control protein FliK [Methylophaga sp.]|uniref:flagellar hook-length control protein FliK n=1 Tax=Methylophaga sp. TaxID=2024840 RepID=UPI00271BCBE3|nr:flagellar hook-length control protein FliK [Methylophaga sp.]MDO8826515.1 flagellar hook-length control protein FliK [Methylophaga sp.]
MTQLLNLPVINAPTGNNADKPVTATTNSKDNEAFASELDRRVNDTQPRGKDKTAKADSTQEVKTEDKDKTTKAEKAETKDGKKLPPEKSDTDAETTDGEAAIKMTEQANPLPVLSLADSSETAVDKKISDVVASGNKTVVPTISTDTGKANQTAQGQTNTAELSATSIRADILQALQKQGTEGESVATEKFKSMMQNAGKIPQQSNVVSAEVIASMRQLEPQTERSSATTLSNPLVFSTTTGTATPPVAAATVGSPPVALDIQPQLNNAAWARVMSSRVVWMAREGVQQAELRLNPAHLGPVEVRLSMQNEQTSVTFIASNAAARDALEQALPRLRESFIENGLALNHAEVSHQEQSSQGSEQDEQLGEDSNTAQVIVEVDDNDDESTHLSDVSTDNSVGVSVFA